MVTKEKLFTRLAQAGVGAAVVVFLACIGLATAVFSDKSWLETLSGYALMLAGAVMVVGLLAALIGRKWLLAIADLGGLLGGLVVVFLTFIGIGAGQHHPPRQDFEEESVEVVERDTLVRLDGQLAVGSWWTDGEHYFQVKRATADAVSFEGMTLHEGGLELALAREGDSLRVKSPRGEFNMFAPVGSLVRHLAVRSLEGQPDVELLVAYADAEGAQPVAVLQLFDGDELQFELGGVHALLDGVYADAEHEWTFFDDGFVSLATGEEPRPYTVEQFYHELTNVVCLPDGKHVALTIGTDRRLVVSEARIDPDEEEWVEAQPRKILFTLEAIDAISWTAEDKFWGTQRLITPAMLNFFETDGLAQLSEHYQYLTESDYSFGPLNAALLRKWAK